MVFTPIQQVHSPMKIVKLTMVALFCTLFVMGCAAWKTPTTVERPPLSPDKIQYLLSRFATDAVQETLKAIAQISIEHPAGKYTRKVALLAQRPSSLRIDAIPLFGPPDFFMSANEKLLRIFLPAEGKYYVGRPTKENLARFFRIPIPVNQTVSLLMGAPPISMTGNLRLRGYGDGNWDRIDSLSGDRHLQSIWLDPTDDTLKKVEVFGKKGTRLYTAFFDDFISFGERSYPQRLRIAMEGMKKIDVKIRYIDLEISHGNDSSPFNLPIPEGIEPIFLH